MSIESSLNKSTPGPVEDNIPSCTPEPMCYTHLWLDRRVGASLGLVAPTCLTLRECIALDGPGVGVPRGRFFLSGSRTGPRSN